MRGTSFFRSYDLLFCSKTLATFWHQVSYIASPHELRGVGALLRPRATSTVLTWRIYKRILLVILGISKMGSSASFQEALQKVKHKSGLSRLDFCAYRAYSAHLEAAAETARLSVAFLAVSNCCVSLSRPPETFVPQLWQGRARQLLLIAHPFPK